MALKKFQDPPFYSTEEQNYYRSADIRESSHMQECHPGRRSGTMSTPGTQLVQKIEKENYGEKAPQWIKIFFLIYLILCEMALTETVNY